MVSIIMPAYNAEKTIAASIRSVLAQTYGDYELIVIDDCSVDASRDIVQKFASAHSNIRLIGLKKNAGAAAARNCGIEAAKGEWVAFLDSDDLWRADKLQKQLDFIRETGAPLSYTASAFIDAKGNRYKYILRAKRRLDYRGLLKANLLSCSSVMVRRDIIARHKMPEGDHHEDYAAWLLILKECEYACGLDEPLLIYRLLRGSKSFNRIKSARMNFNTYRFIGYGRAAAFLLMLRYSVHSIRKRLSLIKY